MSKKPAAPKKSPALHTCTLRIIDVEGGKIRIETETKPEVKERVKGLSPAVDLTMWLQALIIARLQGKPRAR